MRFEVTIENGEKCCTALKTELRLEKYTSRGSGGAGQKRMAQVCRPAGPEQHNAQGMRAGRAGECSCQENLQWLSRNGCVAWRG